MAMKVIETSQCPVLVVEQESSQRLAQFSLISLDEKGKQKHSGQRIPSLPLSGQGTSGPGRRLQANRRYAHRVTDRTDSMILPGDASPQ